MKDILQSDFAKGYGLTRQVPLLYSECSGSFSLNDSKACAVCKEPYRPSCDETVLTVKVCREITKIDFEAFINGFQGKIGGGRCDYLLYSEYKIALVELTCINPKYLGPRFKDGQKVEGKQERAYKQIKDSIDKLIQVPSLKEKVDSYPNKVGLFGYRAKSVAPFMGNVDEVAKGMEDFMKVTSEIDSLNLSTDMGNGFLFMKVGYPDIYDWDNL